MREPPDGSSVSRVRVPLAKPRICGATCPSDHPVVQLRENTWVQPGRCGFDSHRECQFRRAVEYGLSVKREIASGFEPRPSRQYGWVSISPLVRRIARAPALFDGSQDWVIAHNDVVAGSSPASGTKCRSSSVVEHVNSQFVSYPSVLSAGRRLWVLVDPVVAVQFRPAEHSVVV